MTALLIVAAGSRHHRDAALIGESLYAVIREFTTGRTITRITIRHGACPEGADPLFAEFCASEAEWFERGGVTLVEDPQPAVWDLCGPGCPPRPHRVTKKPGDTLHPGALPDYCPKAGPRRNAGMLTPDVGVCAGFPLGASYGTRGCMRLAAERGIPVRPFPLSTKHLPSNRSHDSETMKGTV